MSDIEAFLKDWLMPDEVIKRFKENDVKVEQLSMIDDTTLKELCPLIGVWIDLKQKIDNYLTSTTNTVSNSYKTKSVTSDLSENEILDDLSALLPKDLIIRPDFPEFDLRTLLTISPCGNGILTYYSTHSILTNKHRNQLTEIIIRHLFTRLVNHKITYEEYNIITAKIIALFPRENSGTYFVPPVKKRESISGKPSFAKGKLVDKVRNTLHKTGEKRKSTVMDENVIAAKIKKVQEVEDDVKDKIIFLKNNNEPWAQVIEYWSETFKVRESGTYDKIADFIAEWNILNDPRSDVLINLDFEKLYPKRSSSFFSNWKIFINKIISIKFGESKDDALISVNESIQQQPDDDKKLTDEVKLLCYLIPPRGRLNKHRKFSTLECIENFIIDVENPGDIQQNVEAVNRKALLNGQSVQPYLIKCGSAEQCNYYLVIDKVRYKFVSPFKAFDTLFKSYHVFHAAYPAAASHLYVLIQRCVYGIETKYDKIVPYIVDLLSLAKV